MGASSGAPTAGANAMPDLMSNANLAQMPQASFSAGAGGPQFGAFNSVDMAGSAPSTQMADFSGQIPQTPGAQANAGVLPDQQQGFMDKMKGADWKGISKELAGQNPANKPTQMTPVNTQAAGAQGALPNLYTGLLAPQAPSGAMQAMQGILSRV